MTLKRFWLCACLVLTLGAPGRGQEADAAPPDPADPADPAFRSWLTELRDEAAQKGIAAPTLDRALGDVRLLKRVVAQDRNQAEFVETYQDYLTKRVTDWRIAKGREKLAALSPLIEEIGAKYRVQPRYIAAIWGMETNYGGVKPGYRLFDTLVTLAYDPRRSGFYRTQLFHALTILDRGLADYENMTSSYGGAMGQPQFLPAAYLDYAVDYDGDGRRNIWTSEADVLASIAHYLSRHGWRDDLTWGRPVIVPDGIEAAAKTADGVPAAGRCKRYRSLGPSLALGQWQDLGVRRLNGADLPNRPKLPAALIVSDSQADRGWLVYQNFCTLMAYNAAFKYALAVGLLSDQIRRP